MNGNEVSRDQSGGGDRADSRPGGLGRVVPPGTASSDDYALAANRDAHRRNLGYTRVAYRDHNGYSVPYHTDAIGPYGDAVDDGSSNPFTLANADSLTAPGYGDDSADADPADERADTRT